jgi:hypothetical protein
MDRALNARCTSLVIRALFAALCVFVIPKLARGEPDAAAPDRKTTAKPSKSDPLVGGGRPMHLSSRLFPESDDCAVAKVDIWLERGRVTYSVFVPGQRTEHRVETRPGGAEGTSMIIGGKDCLISVRVERAANSSGGK